MHPGSAIAERSVELPATAAAAGIARRELAATPGLSGELGYRVLLLASELIAVFVADVEPRPDRVLRLSIAVTADRVRITVTGDGPHESADDLLHSRETPSLGGYGLQIVDRMADAWGVAGDRAQQIWFELLRS
jgi:anti-sigma regulatory factor (Ser/Thr protein kinase)